MMRPMTLSELVQPLAATLQGADCEFSSVSTDSRTVAAGDLFVALKGENFDGHDYIGSVAGGGAVAAMVSQTVKADLPLLCVKDTQQALGRMGAHNRQLYRGPLVAITGSSGKTTAKNLVQSVLSQGGETLATEGNYNNEIGVPLTLLRLTSDYDYAVVEMGAARAGDIRWLCELGRPSVALLLNAMSAHLEGFGSVDAVAQAKGEIFDDLGPDAFAIINADQPWADEWRSRAGQATVLDFAVEGPAAFTAADITARGVAGISFEMHTPAGQAHISLALPGKHNVANALAAAAVGYACGLSLAQIQSGLESAQAVAGRLSACEGVNGAVVIDDCYNANPGSVRAAIDTLASCEGRRTLVLGAMRELGPTSESLHREIGSYARDAQIDRLWGVGEELEPAVQAFGEAGRWFPDCAAAIEALTDEFGGEDTVLVKGSRGARMERVLNALLAKSREEN